MRFMMKEDVRYLDKLMLKAFMGGVAALCCALAGRSMAGRGMRRARLIAETMDSLQLLRIHMLDNLMPLQAALEKANGGILRECARLLPGNDTAGAWSELLRSQKRRGGMLDSLTNGDIDALTRFFGRLGATSLDEQKQLFDVMIKEMGMLEAEARSEGDKKNRLYMTLGALTGAALIIAVI